MAVLLFALAAGLAGHAASTWLWRREARRAGRTGPLERALSSAIVALALAIASAWLLSALRLLARGPIVATYAALGIAGGGALLLRAPRGEARAAADPSTRPGPRAGRVVLAVVALAPPAAWLAFALWRGLLLPPLNADGLAYHLPKAALLLRDRGFAWLGEAPDLRIATTPFDYELLLAEVIAVDGDRATEWVATLAWALFALGAAAVAERWWRSWLAAAACGLLVGGMPVALLGSPIQSNDSLLAVFAVGAILWSGRLVAEGGAAPLALASISALLAAGTKVNGLAIAAGAAVAIAWGLARHGGRARVDARRCVLAGAALVAACLACGLVPYVANYVHRGHWLGSLARGDAAPRAGDGDPIFLYGDWSNLLEVPALLLAVPFASRLGVWIPWRGARWWWPGYDATCSHFGAAVTIAAAVAAVAAWRWGIRAPRDARWRERVASTLAGAIACALLAPVRLVPTGAFAQAPRLCAFAVPVLAAWAIAPLVAGPRRRLRELASRAVVVALAGWFAWCAVDVGRKDRLAPVRHLTEVVRDLDLHLSILRASAVLDRVAGERDVVAIDAGFDAWIYPAFGAARARTVRFLDPGCGPVQVPPDVQWVAIDRGWFRIWGNPDLVDFGRIRLRNSGPLRAEDLRVIVALAEDPEWEVVWADLARNQAVFRRLAPGEREARPVRDVRRADPPVGALDAVP